jgi:hypothetical protein
MDTFSRLVRQCAWCGIYLGLSEPVPAGQTGITHGICKPCAYKLAGKELEQCDDPTPSMNT